MNTVDKSAEDNYNCGDGYSVPDKRQQEEQPNQNRSNVEAE